MSLQRIDALIQFTRANKAAYDAFPFNIPKNYLVYSIDTKELRLGDGEHTYAQLSNILDLDNAFYAFKDIITTNMVDTPISGNINKIIIVNSLGHLTYGTLDITNLVSFITNNPSIEATQTGLIDSLNIIFNKILSSLQVSDNGSLVLVNLSEDQFIPGEDINEYISNTTLEIYSNLAFNIIDLKMYSDEACTTEITELTPDSIAYAKIFSLNNYNENINYGLVSDNSEIAIDPTTTDNIFMLTLSSSADSTSPTTFTGTGNLNGVEKSVDKVINVIIPNKVDFFLYNRFNAGNSNFKSVKIDQDGNYIIVGDTDAEGSGDRDALIIKVDINFNILIKKLYGGAGIDAFENLIIDNDNNYVCIGSTTSEGNGHDDGLIVKFDSNLNILYKKKIGGGGYDTIAGIVFDGNGDYIIAGSTSSDGGGTYDIWIMKFDVSLNLISNKVYGLSGEETATDMTIDTLNNIIISGFTGSISSGGYDIFVVKFDNDLNLINNKIYGGFGEDLLRGITSDANNNIICVGHTGSEGQGNYDCIIIKLDPSLNILAKKIYGGSGNDDFFNVSIDNDGNYIVIGTNGSESAGYADSLIVKFDSDLNILGKKNFGNGVYDIFNRIVISNNDAIVAGISTDPNDFSLNGIFCKINLSLPSGTFISNNGNYTFNDSNVVYADSNLTAQNGTFTLSDSILTLSDSNLNLADIILLSQIIDFI